jgi:hypothetical protein
MFGRCYPSFVIPGRALARTRNPEPRSNLWIPGLHPTGFAGVTHPGMTNERLVPPYVPYSHFFHLKNI